MADVVVARWPHELERLEAARAGALPRLLLVESAELPPPPVDPLEDWIRMPAPAAEVRTRVATLAARARAMADDRRPCIDADGLLHHGGRWVALSTVEQALARTLVDRFGAVVSREVLTTRAWPGQVPSRNLLDVQMMRVRRRVETVGLEVRTVRARGYLMSASGSCQPRVEGW
jgi:DNA-binding response OmpR family regulator